MSMVDCTQMLVLMAWDCRSIPRIEVRDRNRDAENPSRNLVRPGRTRFFEKGVI
jgi:hypothetical protein